jgi:hypothetical protein
MVQAILYIVISKLLTILIMSHDFNVTTKEQSVSLGDNKQPFYIITKKKFL